MNVHLLLKLFEIYDMMLLICIRHTLWNDSSVFLRFAIKLSSFCLFFSQILFFQGPVPCRLVQ